MAQLDFSKAVTTRDGCIINMSEHAEIHPVYGTEAFRIRVDFELSKYQQAMLCELLQSGDLEHVHRSTRSFIDQLGVFGAHKDSTIITPTVSGAEMETLITSVSGKDNIALQALKNIFRYYKSRYCRLLLTPPEAKVGERAMPLLTQSEIYYANEALDVAAIEAAWNGGSGRASIFPAKRERSMPTEFAPKSFFLLEMNGMDTSCPSHKNLWVLKRRVRRGDWKNKTHIRHGDACGFDPIRSTGRRQGEFFVLGDQPEIISDDLKVIAEEFTLDYENSYCAQTKGV